MRIRPAPRLRERVQHLGIVREKRGFTARLDLTFVAPNGRSSIGTTLLHLARSCISSHFPRCRSAQEQRASPRPDLGQSGFLAHLFNLVDICRAFWLDRLAPQRPRGEAVGHRKAKETSRPHTSNRSVNLHNAICASCDLRRPETKSTCSARLLP